MHIENQINPLPSRCDFTAIRERPLELIDGRVPGRSVS